MAATAGYTQRRTIGAALWVLSIQYYIVQVVVAGFWAKSNSYSWANNTISDLGNTHCGLYGSRLVCSPLHAAMNISFVVLGITMIGGAYFLQRQLAGKRLAKLGFGCMALAGAGTILVGFYPENTVSQLHVIGAALSFVLGNLGMIIIGVCVSRLPLLLRAYTVLSGMLGLLALVLFQANSYVGIGAGGVERFAGYPQSIWMILFGTYILVRRRSPPKAGQG
jgi:hypothetical membrane protein